MRYALIIVIHLPSESWSAWQFFSTFLMKTRFMWSQCWLNSAVFWQYSSILQMFFLRWGSAIFAQIISRSIMVRILNSTFSWKWTQLIALKARQRSFRFDFPDDFQMNSKVMLFQPYVRQLQWNISTSVFSTFSQMPVTYLTQSKFLPEKNSIKYSPLAIRYFYCWPLPPYSYYYCYYYCPGRPWRKRSRRCAVNLRSGFYRMKTRMAYLRVSALVPSTQPSTYGFVCKLGIVSFFPLFQLRLCSEKTTLCLRSNLIDSSIDVSTLFAFSCMSLRLCASKALSNSTNSEQIYLLLELKRIVAKRELLRHFTSMLYSRQTQLSSRARISTFGGIFWICGRRKPSMSCERPSICLTIKPSGEFLMRSKCGANFFLRLTMNLQRYSPQPAGDLLMSMSLNFLLRASCSY